MRILCLLIVLVQDSLAQVDGARGLPRPNENAVLFQARETKSVTLAVIASLVLPGAGEWYARNVQRARYSFITDAGLWMTYAGFNVYGDWVRGDARQFAGVHAGVKVLGKDEQFEVNIGNFMNVYDYNQARLRDRQYDRLYDPNSEYAWQWDSDSNRLRFRHLRIRSDEIYQNGKFVIAALVVNRIISAFAAGRAAAAYNRSSRAESGWRLDAGAQGGNSLPEGFAIRLSKSL